MNEEIKCMNAGPAPRLLHNLGKALEFHANITSSQIVSSESSENSPTEAVSVSPEKLPLTAVYLQKP